jgi:hypothetical protein
MLNRVLPLFLAALALAVVLTRPVWADEKPVEAHVVKPGDGKITLKFKGDEAKHTHDVAKDAKITLDDKDAKLGDLKEGYHVLLTFDAKDVITKIVAHTKDPKEK